MAGFSYYGFVSQTIYTESVSHLTEIFHQANQTLYNLVADNWGRMRMWVPYLAAADSDTAIKAYVELAREQSGLTNFFFISRNGDYLSIRGTSGYLDLREKLADLILDREPVVINSVVPDKPEIMVFAVPAALGSYDGFEYEAIAITYSNSDLVQALEISVFEGQASTFAVLPDGRVVVDSCSEDLTGIHNILAFLEESGSVLKTALSAIEEDFQTGKTGAMMFEIGEEDYYLVYEPAGFQDWMVLGIVPADVVNASMSKL